MPSGNWRGPMDRRLEDKADNAIGWIAGVLVILLLAVNAYEFGKDSGRREAIQAMKCDTNSGYSIVDTRTGKCAVTRGKYRG